MPKFFVHDNQIENKMIYIKGNDVNHIKNVLRAKINDKLTICNIEKEKNYLCEIENLNNMQISCKIIEEYVDNAESNTKVTIFQGLPKSDKMELIIQKSVELGVYDITPVQMARCVVKLKNDKNKIDRWNTISQVAAKQCGRSIIPKINDLIEIKDICKMVENYDIVIVAYEKEEKNSLKETLNKLLNTNLKIAIVIGPEGGFEEKEIQELLDNGCKIVTLGKRILRTETVALNMLSIIMYEMEGKT